MDLTHSLEPTISLQASRAETGGAAQSENRTTPTKQDQPSYFPTSTEKSAQVDLEAGDNVVLTASAQEPLYSVFTQKQKIFIAVMATLSAFFSPLSANIYFPALNTLANDFHVTPSLINLTITTYQIMQGIAPSVTGDFGDQAGRRPAYIICFVIYLGANIGLALQNSYAALLVLRCLQSAGSSGTVALAFGVIADVTTTAERGIYMGLAFGGALLAPAIGPIMGGALSASLGWRAIFWFLTIFSGAYLAIYILVMPETNRKTVGNGSIKPRAWWNKSGLDMIKAMRNKAGLGQAPEEDIPKIQWPRPWKIFIVFREKDVVLVLIFNAVINAALYDVLTSLPTQFASIYGLSITQIGLCYL
jgi:MFS family permease